MRLSATSLKELGTQIKPLFSVKSTVAKDFIGVEIENEFLSEVSLPAVQNWRVVGDGSLRYYGFEYVSTPMSFEDTLQSVEKLALAIGRMKQKPTDSIRTSTHVHFNMQEAKAIDVIKFATVYWILEVLLSDFAGTNRKGNLFCLRLKDAESISEDITKAMLYSRFKESHIFSENYRYSSVNFAALRKFGTLEFRLMRGTFNKNLLTTWITALQNIKSFSESLKTLDAVREKFMNTDAKDFAKEALGSAYNEIKKAAQSPVENLIREGFKYVENILYSSETFDIAFLIEEALRERMEIERKFSRNVLVDVGKLPYDQGDNENVFGNFILTDEEI